MNSTFVEINRLMKQLYYINQQWFQVRDQFAHLPDKEQERLFTQLLALLEPLDALRRTMAAIERLRSRQGKAS
jgi:hypothetical protein